jgi:ribosomal protein S18 acetylase RimI-like enzyme
LLHYSAADMYDRFAGGRARALSLLERSLGQAGNASSGEVVWLAEVDGRVAAALAGFPVEEAVRRSAAFLRLALRSAPPWHWLPALRLYWVGGRAAPTPPSDSFYVDALATDPRVRRRGAASALLGEAEHQARTRGLGSVALDTTAGNSEARALYAREGFEEVAYRPAARGLPGFVALVKRLS